MKNKASDSSAFSSKIRVEIDRLFQERRDVLAPLTSKLQSYFNHINSLENTFLKYLYASLPLSDLANYDVSLFYGYVKQAAFLWEKRPYVASYDEGLFLNYVLCPRVNNEDLTNFMAEFYQMICPRLEGLSEREQVIAVNYWCLEQATYQSTDDRTASPLTVIKRGFGRCGEESTLAVAAYRSVGIPARQIYVPKWSHCDDNHAWVEVWCENRWQFLGACEPEDVLNLGWFNQAATRAILVHSRKFSEIDVYCDKENVLYKKGCVNYLNQTERYASCTQLTIITQNTDKSVVTECAIDIQLVNYGGYHTIAHLMSNTFGQADILLGKGTIKIVVSQGHCIAEKIVTLTTPHQKVTIDLEVDFIYDKWQNNRFKAPTASPLDMVNDHTKRHAKSVKKVAYANALREEKSLQWCESINACDADGFAAYYHIAQGNYLNIHAFVTHHKANYQKELKKSLLSQLSNKDLADISTQCLIDYLACASAYKGLYDDLMYHHYVLNPKVATEKIVSIKQALTIEHLSCNTERYRQSPEQLYLSIDELISNDDMVDDDALVTHSTGMFILKRANRLSKDIHFVKHCRAIGIPARLNCLTKAPEYYDAHLKKWQTPFEKNHDKTSLIIQNANCEGSYNQTWTLAKLTEKHIDGFKRMAFTHLDLKAVCIEQATCHLSLETGVYRLVTTKRLPCGDIVAQEITFKLVPSQGKIIELLYAKIALEDIYQNISLPHFKWQVIKKKYGKSHNTSNHAMYIWLTSGGEPTTHVVNELKQNLQRINDSGVPVYLISTNEIAFKSMELLKLIDGLDYVFVLLDKISSYKQVARLFYLEINLPLALLVKNNKIGIYAVSGYNPSTINLMLDLIQ